MAKIDRSNTWSAFFFVLLLVGGFCVMGFWQTYQIECVNGKSWSFEKFPPQYVCKEYRGY